MKKMILNTIGSTFSYKARKILEEFGNVSYENLSTQEELKNSIKKYEILLIGLGLNIDKEIINSGKYLKIIATATTGLDHIDVNYAKEKGIKILSLRGERKFLNTITGTAELAFSLMLNISRNIIPAIESAKKYCWTEKFRGHNLYGKTLGIIGLGRLGSMMAKYGRAFNMKILAFDPYVKINDFKKAGAKVANFSKLLEASDYISLHVHLNNETENMINKDVLKKMKKGVYLINTSRGKIVNENNLLFALKSGKIGGYATDVLSEETNFNKEFKNNKLIEYSKKNNNVIITPHVGGVTFESREMTDIFISNKIKRFIKL